MAPDLEVQQVLGVDDVPNSLTSYCRSRKGSGCVSHLDGPPGEHVEFTGNDPKTAFASSTVSGKRALGLTAGQSDTSCGLCAGLAYRYTKVISKCPVIVVDVCRRSVAIVVGVGVDL